MINTRFLAFARFLVFDSCIAQHALAVSGQIQATKKINDLLRQLDAGIMILAPRVMRIL
jgi:hypothetical protein